MLLKSLQLTVRNLRGITRIISNESCLTIQSQRYGRYAPRRHAAIVNEDELFDVLENTTPASEIIKKTKPIKPKAKEIKNKNVEIHKEESKTSNVYTKIKENEKLVSSIMMSLKSKKRRKKDEQILLEGRRFIRDAMEAGLQPETIIFSNWEEVKDLQISEKKTRLYKVPYRSIQLWSTLTTSPGVMGIFRRPNPIQVSKKKSLPITIICDNIRDPGNMGSILRAAAGVGCEKVLLTKGCVDFWDPKVLRSATGAHFRIPIFGSQEWDEIKSSINHEADIYVADNNVDCNVEHDESEMTEEVSGEDEKSSSMETKKYSDKYRDNSLLKMRRLPVVPYYSADYTQNEVVLIVGGETQGLSNETFALIENRQGIRVNIPLNNDIDSLNAGMALGIVAFEIKRQFLLVQHKLDKLQ